MESKLIVGLGNPGLEYEKNRHNVGFMTIDAICKKLNVNLDKKGFNGYYGFYKTSTANVIFAKPHTYMNLSGEFVIAIAKFYKIQLKDILIIYDDMDTSVGKIRVRSSGSSGGQNGIKNIINLIGSQDIARIRIGIGKPTQNQPVTNWVLGDFKNNEINLIQDAIEKSSDAAICFIDHPIDFVMNKFNK